MSKSIRIKANLNFERVEIFLRVKGRLPETDDDIITGSLLKEFCKKYQNDELKQGVVSLKYLYRLIQDGKIKTTAEILKGNH